MISVNVSNVLFLVNVENVMYLKATSQLDHARHGFKQKRFFFIM